MYPLTESFFGVYLSVLIIFGLLLFGKNLPALEPYSLYIILFFALCIFINFNYSFGIYEQYENKKNY
jgi:hypothetical protein